LITLEAVPSDTGLCRDVYDRRGLLVSPHVAENSREIRIVTFFSRKLAILYFCATGGVTIDTIVNPLYALTS
jgi:hypothetical protein